MICTTMIPGLHKYIDNFKNYEYKKYTLFVKIKSVYARI